ncbi:N-acetylglucosamine-6-phosphate deacetylase [Bacillus sp. Marseille-Q3570]|uniref:N-acetylglucosamine-6-phosphate deacetylase n=1 Tax=Bacillus sp. Marseille-Q3570 TaxID=2963522 RepID=UPI0021B844D2|nr:N-acetylglucosamine-6-phosphate deacetylase [Bacillus sp. Marseille-Q3570]
MTIQTITGGKVFIGEQSFQSATIHIENGKIKALSDQTIGSSDIELEDGDLVLPGRIDGHIHGANGHDVMDGTVESIDEMAKALVAEGTTSFLPTTMTAPGHEIEQALTSVFEYMTTHNERGKSDVIGIHLEGPFISEKKRGAQNPKYIQTPDVDAFNHWNRLSGSNIKVVTIAPEIEGALDFIKEITSLGIVASIGHSDGTYAEIHRALEAGAKQFTHLYNGMRSMHHREPGVVGAAFLTSGALAEIIADGLHCAPEMIRLAYEIKGKRGLLMITDAMRAKCLGNGSYDLGGQEVYVEDGKATLQDGTLAGSVLTMQKAFENISTFTKADIEAIIFMSSINPAKQYGVYDRKGSIDIGKDADLIVLDENLELKMTICRGEIAYTRG